MNCTCKSTYEGHPGKGPHHVLGCPMHATSYENTPAELMAEQEQGEFAAIIDRLREFREKRGWKFDHTPRNLAASIAIEAGELLEHFQWEAPGEGRACVEAGEPEEAADRFVAGELADVLIYALNLADVLDIDPVKAVNEKITVNEMRSPLPGETRPVGGA